MKFISEKTERFQIKGSNRVTVNKQGSLVIDNFVIQIPETEIFSMEKHVEVEKIDFKIEEEDEILINKAEKFLSTVEKKKMNSEELKKLSMSWKKLEEKIGVEKAPNEINLWIIVGITTIGFLLLIAIGVSIKVKTNKKMQAKEKKLSLAEVVHENVEPAKCSNDDQEEVVVEKHIKLGEMCCKPQSIKPQREDWNDSEDDEELH